MKISKLPMFPLTIMPLPGEKTSLHIFEHRYRELLEHIEQGNRTFGIPYVTEEGNFQFGVELRLIEITERYDSGESDIIVEAIRFFEVLSFQNQGNNVLYPTAEVVCLNELNRKPLSTELMAEWIKFTEDVLKREELQRFTHIIEILPYLNLAPTERQILLKNFVLGTLNSWIVQRIRMQRVIASQRRSIKKGFSLN